VPRKRRPSRTVSEDDYKIPRFLKIAYRAAKKSTGEYRLGAVLVQRGKPISVGYNKYNRTNKLAKKFFGVPSIHAECDALHKAGATNIRGSVVYVARVRPRGELALSRPCDNCMNLLRTKGIRRVVYSTHVYPFFVEEKI
jgi:deoxycytidylate deaminase